jgi:hypothetical protein
MLDGFWTVALRNEPLKVPNAANLVPSERRRFVESFLQDATSGKAWDWVQS